MNTEFGQKEISNKRLTLGDIPSARAKWQTIEMFALTFDGYKRWGGSRKCAAVANARRDRTLDELRTCLFFEQRRWRHFAETPDRKAMKYIREIVEKIRVKVRRARA